MRHLALLVIAIALLVCVTPVSAQDSVYVSLNGNFRIDIPDGWVQVDPTLVDLFLRRNKAGAPILKYDAAFAPATSVPFYKSTYCIVTVTQDSTFNQHAIDSVLKSVGSTFGQGIKYFPVADFIADLKSQQPSYDEEKKMITVVNDIYDAGKLTKKNLLVWKFYEQGMVNFYFYAPDSLFEQSKSVFHSILTSFSTKDVESFLPHEKLKLADIDVSKDNDDFDDNNNTSLWITFATLIVVIMVVILRRKRKKQ